MAKRGRTREKALYVALRGCVRVAELPDPRGWLSDRGIYRYVAFAGGWAFVRRSTLKTSGRGRTGKSWAWRRLKEYYRVRYGGDLVNVLSGGQLSSGS